jgi:hypothetical protein
VGGSSARLRVATGAALGLLALVAACRDFGGAFNDYCRKTGTCGDSGVAPDGSTPADSGQADSGGSDGGRNDGGVPDGGSGSTQIVITVNDRYVTGTGIVLKAWSAGQAVPGGIVDKTVMEAFVDGGAVPVYWLDGGDFAIYVPPGSGYQVGRVAPGFDHEVLVSSSRTALDLSEYILGRPDVQFTTMGSNTNFQVDAGGMVAWNDNTDVLEMTSPNANIGGLYLYIPNYNPAFPVGTPPVNGDTHLNMGVSWDLYSLEGDTTPLINSSLGDQTIIYQLGGATTDAGLPYSRIAAAITDVQQPLTLVAGGNSLLQGNFVKVSPTINGTFLFDDTAFGAIAPAQPPATLYAQSNAVFVEAVFGGSAYGRYDQMPDIAICFIDAGTGTIPEAMQFGDPFPPSWSLMYLAGQVQVTHYSANVPGLGTVTADEAINLTVGALYDGGTVRVAPLVAPITSPTINGQIADTFSLSAVGVTPLIQWTPPASLNTPSYYTVLIIQLVGNQTIDGKQNIVGMLTTDNQVRLPAGYLTPGQQYFIRFNAVYDPGSSPGTPFISGFPYGYAMSLTRNFSP